MRVSHSLEESILRSKEGNEEVNRCKDEIRCMNNRLKEIRIDNEKIKNSQRYQTMKEDDHATVKLSATIFILLTITTYYLFPIIYYNIVI